MFGLFKKKQAPWLTEEVLDRMSNEEFQALFGGPPGKFPTAADQPPPPPAARASDRPPLPPAARASDRY